MMSSMAHHLGSVNRVIHRLGKYTLLSRSLSLIRTRKNKRSVVDITLTQLALTQLVIYEFALFNLLFMF